MAGMSALNWEELTALELLLAEQAVMNLRVLNKACREAADGKVLGVCEVLGMEQGRDLTRRTIEAALQAEVSEVEKKAVRCGSAPAG